MQMSSYRSRPVLARFEYCAYISRYLQVAHWASDRFLARFVHRGCCYVIFTYQGRVRRYCSEPPLAFPWTEVSKAAQKANGGSGSA